MILFSIFSKKICVHSYRFRIVFTEKRILNLGITLSYLKTSVFARLHEYDERLFSKLFILKSAFENLRLFSVPENTGYVWTVAVFGGKIHHFQKHPATCGRGFKLPTTGD